MGNPGQVLDVALGQANSMLDIHIHAVLCGTISDLLHAVSILRVNSFEYQIERRMRFSCESQNSVSLVRPNEFATANLPSESSRMTQPLSLRQVLPSSLQLCLRCFQLFIGLLKCIRSLSTPSIQDVLCFARQLSGSALCHLRPFAGAPRCGSSDCIRARMSRFSKNHAWSDSHPANHDIHHGSGQVIGPDYLIGEQRPKRRVDPSQE